MGYELRVMSYETSQELRINRLIKITNTTLRTSMGFPLGD